MTWVEVVKFWAYQAYQLQLIVYTNLTLTIPGLELFSLVSRQWVFSAQENTFNTVPLSGFTKIFETAIHKTGATATYVTSMRDTNGDSFYIASNASGTSSSGWLGLFK